MMDSGWRIDYGLQAHGKRVVLMAVMVTNYRWAIGYILSVMLQWCYCHLYYSTVVEEKLFFNEMH